MYDVRIPNLRWLEEKGKIKHLDDDPTNEQGMILFYGPSNFGRWSRNTIAIRDHRPLEEDIRMKDGSQACLNHAFGTSTAEELLYYYPKLVRPWNPRALVLSSSPLGNNATYGYNAGEVAFLMFRILEWARKDFPGIRLYLEIGRPAPKLREATPAKKSILKEYDQIVYAYAAAHDDLTLIDLTKTPDLFQEGHMGDYDYPRDELYVEDGGHFNQAGYDVYRDIYLRVLDDLL